MRGLDVFRKHFQDFTENYVLIGGSACLIIMEDFGLSFRATKDLDIVILAEVLNPKFGRRLWEFIDEGGYSQRFRADGEQELYRFVNPYDENYPAMLELFSRQPKVITLPPDAVISPLPFEESIASLSAILLNDDYYEALASSTKKIDSISVLDERILIPFKAKAYTNLRLAREAGTSVQSRDITKHRADVFRLLQLLPDDTRIELPERITTDLEHFVSRIVEKAALIHARLEFPAPTSQPGSFGVEWVA